MSANELSKRGFLRTTTTATAASFLLAAALFANLLSAQGTPPTYLIGYNEHRTDLPGGRRANTVTNRAYLVRGDGTGRRPIAEQLAKKPHTSTQFAGWSPDGGQAIILSYWQSPENAAREEKLKTFLLTPEGYLVDTYLVDVASGKASNMTAENRVSFHNAGLFFWPGAPNRLGFTALIHGEMHPFSMDRDGKNKTDLARGSGFTYGFNVSPDGKQIAYHKEYQVYVADADGANPVLVKTGQPFNFCPQWSPDGRWIMLLSGAHYNCHPYLAGRDGKGPRKLADRGGYEGVVQFLDVPDFHGGSSDLPAWSPDGKWVYYTAKAGRSVELMRVSLAGKAEQLTHSRPGVLHYHTRVSPDSKKVLFGSNRSGIRQLYVADADGKNVHAITNVDKGWAAMHGHWRPLAGGK